jgi:hypothetical protein
MDSHTLAPGRYSIVPPLRRGLLRFRRNMEEARVNNAYRYIGFV